MHRSKKKVYFKYLTNCIDHKRARQKITDLILEQLKRHTISRETVPFRLKYVRKICWIQSKTFVCRYIGATVERRDVYL
jgi:hypothetical protein